MNSVTKIAASLAVFLFLLPELNQLRAQNTDFPYSANLSGMITVDHRLDDTGDYSGIGVAIVEYGRAAERVDTLFHAVTDINGRFSGTAHFPERDEYIVSITRNQRLISTATLVLSDGDDVEMTGEIPAFGESFRARSVENDAVQDYRRVERNFNRVVDYINSGLAEVTQDTIPILLRTWSDLYWSVDEIHPNTLAAESATYRSIEIIQGWDDELALERARLGLQHKTRFMADRGIIAADAITRLSNMQAGIDFLDSLRTSDLPEEDRILLEMRKIEILVEHDQNDKALELLDSFRESYGDDPTLNQWADIYSYDLRNLAPGMAAPEFELRLRDERTVKNDDFDDRYLLVEVVDLATTSYMTQHTVMNFFYEEMKDKIQILTVPVNESPITIEAFYEERKSLWPVAKSREVHNAGLMERLNVVIKPTRLLIGPDGKIVRKYTGTDFTIVEQDIRNILNEEPS